MADYIKLRDVVSALDKQREMIEANDNLTTNTKAISAIILLRAIELVYSLPTVNIKGGKKHG